MTEISKDSPATIKIRFVTEDDLVSALIRLHTWCDYSHVEFAIAMTVEQKFAIMCFAHAQVGKAYDTSAIAGVVLHRDWRASDKWFCSELVAAAFEQALPLLSARDSVNRIVPRDLLLSLRLMAVGGLIVDPHLGAIGDGH